jgi:putative copper export protein
MFDADLLTISLRACVYAATVAVAGSQLVKCTLPELKNGGVNALDFQTRFGIALLLLVEPLRMILFQLTVAGGDAALAMSPSFLTMGVEMAPQQASTARIVMAVFVLFSINKNRWATLLAALAIIGSYALEGHTASEDNRLIYATLLFVHLVIVHWWLAALFPLAAQARSGDATRFHTSIDMFSRVAVVVVPVIIFAGGLLLALLVDWRLDLTNAYQIRFIIKIGLVALILTIAAGNKYWITPQLRSAPTLGAVRMRRSIFFEASVGLAILVATAWVLRTGPDRKHAATVDQSSLSVALDSLPQYLHARDRASSVILFSPKSASSLSFTRSSLSSREESVLPPSHSPIAVF